MRKLLVFLCSIALVLGIVGFSGAATFSFKGTFTQDDDVQLFEFSIGAFSNVTLLTYSYAGGTNAASEVIPDGGFDPILAVFDASGLLIDDNDDGSDPDVGIDPTTGKTYDTFLQVGLNAGDYRVAVSQYDNFANGPFLSNGFERQGEGNFTEDEFGPGPGTGPFWDFTGDQREGFWAFDILDVDTATVNVVPIPSAVWLLGSALIGLVGLKRKVRKK
jgi:hypothetical protein